MELKDFVMHENGLALEPEAPAFMDIPVPDADFFMPLPDPDMAFFIPDIDFTPEPDADFLDSMHEALEALVAEVRYRPENVEA